MKYIDCSAYAEEILNDAKGKLFTKTFAIVSVGRDPASESYIKGKLKDCEKVGISVLHKRIESSPTWEIELEKILTELAKDENVGAIILQLPLPHSENEDYFCNLIPSHKDVDGLIENSKFFPCTPEGVLHTILKELWEKKGEKLAGANVLIVGRGKLVGRPLFDMMLGMDCTVTVAHSKTKNLDEMLGNYDIIISAAGRPNLIDLKKCTNAKIVIDVGVNKVDGKLCGDCFNFDPEDGSDLLVSPVPKGIGLMTRAMLVKHVSEICATEE